MKFNRYKIFLGTVASLELLQFPKTSERNHSYSVYLEADPKALFGWKIEIIASRLDPEWSFAGKFESPWPLNDYGSFKDPEYLFPQPTYQESVPIKLIKSIQEVVKGKQYQLDNLSRPPVFHVPDRYNDESFYSYQTGYRVYTSEGSFEISNYYVRNKLIVMPDGIDDFIEFAIENSFSKYRFTWKTDEELNKAQKEKIAQIATDLKPLMLKWKEGDFKLNCT